MSRVDLALGAFKLLGGDVVSRAAPFGNGVLVVTYHRIGNPAESVFDRSVFSTTEEQFDMQMEFLKRNFEVISPHELPMARRSGRGRYVIITFDDGYRDNYEKAFPILKRHRLQATFFVPTGLIDRRELSWWDQIAWMIRHSDSAEIPAGTWFRHSLTLSGDLRERAINEALQKYKSLAGRDTANYIADLADVTGHSSLPIHLGDEQLMTWNNIRELRLGGMTIGGHSVNHPILSRLSSAEQVQEIRGCYERLHEMTGIRPKAFSYPVGKQDTFNTITRAILLSIGFEYAFSFYGGYQNLLDVDLLDIKRVNIGRKTTQTIFESMTSLPSVLARFA
jgi:peptidoglycan/xylan/chitin deacetylase (PgdA/CDA1 family)